QQPVTRPGRTTGTAKPGPRNPSGILDPGFALLRAGSGVTSGPVPGYNGRVPVRRGPSRPPSGEWEEWSMRPRSATVFAATVALLMLGATALTQQPRPAFGGAMARGGALMILQSEDVQKELKLTDEQKGKVAEVAKTYRGKIMELINLPEGERA